MPGPYFYSFVNSSTEELDSEGFNVSRGGMRATLFTSVIGGLALLIAILIRRYSKKKAQERIRSSLKESNANLSKEQID